VFVRPFVKANTVGNFQLHLRYELKYDVFALRVTDGFWA